MIGRIAFFIIGVVLTAVTINHDYIFPNIRNNFYNIKNVSGYVEIQQSFESITSRMLSDTESDMVYIWLFHEHSKNDWFSNFIDNSEPAYASAIYIKTNVDIPNPIQRRQNMPLLNITNINQNLNGECTSFITNPNHSSNSEDWGDQRLQVRCPIINFKGEIIGAYGISILTETHTDNLMNTVPKLTKILLDYKSQIELNFR